MESGMQKHKEILKTFSHVLLFALFEDSDPDTQVPDPFADDLNPESPDAGGLPPEDVIGDDTELVEPPITD